MPGVEIVKVKSSDAGMRLNRWFLKYYPSLTLGHFQKLVRTKQIKVDGKRAEANTRIFTGQEIRIPPLMHEKALPDKEVLSRNDEQYVRSLVIYMDANLIAINKPAGLAVQGGSGIKKHLAGMLKGLKFELDEAPKLVHRIDKETSGILLLARNRAFAEKLTKAFKEHKLPKTYLAITQNVPAKKEGSVTVPVEEKKAQTLYKVLDSLGERFALVQANPLSGRKHQIRVHLLSLHCPILGDDKYFVEPRAKISEIKNKLYLHAYKMDLSYLYNKKMQIVAPLPEHFDEAIDFLGLTFKETK